MLKRSNNKQNNLLIAVILLVTLGAVGCSKKNEKKGESGDPVSSVVNSSDEDSLNVGGANTLEVNGSSDQNSAGGLTTVFFDLDSSDISGSTKDALNANAEFLKTNKNIKILVEGHCDERGGTQYNLALGEKRAKAVKDYLTAMGVQAKRIETKSLGKESPLDFGHDESAWAKNRRGSFVIVAK